MISLIEECEFHDLNKKFFSFFILIFKWSIIKHKLFISWISFQALKILNKNEITGIIFDSCCLFIRLNDSRRFEAASKLSLHSLFHFILKFFPYRLSFKNTLILLILAWFQPILLEPLTHPTLNYTQKVHQLSISNQIFLPLAHYSFTD